MNKDVVIKIKENIKKYIYIYSNLGVSYLANEFLKLELVKVFVTCKFGCILFDSESFIILDEIILFVTPLKCISPTHFLLMLARSYFIYI